MTTLRVTIDNKKNARLLTNVLKNMTFVKKIEEENHAVANQYHTLDKLFHNIQPGKVFNEIDDPVKWQKNIRRDWEAC